MRPPPLRFQSNRNGDTYLDISNWVSGKDEFTFVSEVKPKHQRNL